MRRIAIAMTLIGLTLNAAAQAQSALTVAPVSGHPNLAVTISGTGFGASEAVDVYVDTVDTLLLVSTSTGTFTASASIPAAAQPGAHYLTAIGRKSGNAGQVTFNVTTPWKEFGYGASRLGWNPYENTLSPSNVSELGTLWSSAVDGGGSTPAISGGRVFVGTIAGMDALSAKTGAVLWHKTAGDTIYASPAVVGNDVYVAGTSGTVYKLKASTGATFWTRALNSDMYSSPVVVDGVVYVGTYEGDTVYALNAATGAIAWSVTLGGRVLSSPAVVNNTVYVGSDDDYLYALDASTGALVWRYQTGGLVESSPAVASGVVYVGSDDGKVYAIKARSGALLWSVTTDGPVYAAPAVANGVVFVGSYNTMYALDAHSGALRWSAPTSGGIVRGAAVANGVVYAACADETLYAFAANYGGILTTAVTGYSFLGSPAVSDGELYFNAQGGNVTALALLASTDARPSARPPALSTLHPNMSLGVSPQGSRAPNDPDND